MATDSSDSEAHGEFIKDVYNAIASDKTKVVLVVSDDDKPDGEITFQVFFDPPFDNTTGAENPDVFGVAAGFIEYMRLLMGPGGDARAK